jgi:hypothetical protein
LGKVEDSQLIDIPPEVLELIKELETFDTERDRMQQIFLQAGAAQKCRNRPIPGDLLIPEDIWCSFMFGNAH